MERRIWLEEMLEKPCPRCHSGKLIYDTKNVLVTETRDSLVENEFYKNGIVCPESNYLVTAHQKCNNCGEVVIINYERSDDIRHVDEQGYEISIWKTVMVHPAFHIIRIPEACSDVFKRHIIKSFGLFWYDQASCGNKIRMALETLLTDFGILPVDDRGRFKSLASRLEEFAKAVPEVKEFLNAIRLIGNSASHDDKLTKEDLLDTYEIIEHSLELLYREKSNAVLLLSQKIAANKGPLNRP